MNELRQANQVASGSTEALALEKKSGTNERDPGTKRVPWLVLGFIVVTILFDFVLSALPLLGFIPLYVDFILIGTIAGQLCFAAVIAGLWGRSWLAGFLVALCLAVTVVVGCIFTIEIVQSYRWGWPLDVSEFCQNLSPVCVLPLLTLATGTPLLGMRALFGWQIVRQSHFKSNSKRDGDVSDLNVSGQLSGVSGLLVMTAITAGAVMTVQSAEMVFGSYAANMLTGALIASAVLAAASTVAVLPAVYVNFQDRSPAPRFAIFALMAGAAALLAVAATWVVNLPPFNPAGIPTFQLWKLGLGVPLCGAVYFIASLYVLRWSGYSLVRARAAVATGSNHSLDPSISSLSEGEDSGTNQVEAVSDWDRESTLSVGDQLQRERRRHWLLVGVTFAVLSIGPIAGGVMDQRRRQEAARLRELQQEALREGGWLKVDFYTNKVTRVDLGPNLDVQWIDQIGDLETVATLSLRNCSIRQDEMERVSRFPALRSLDVSDSDFGDEHLEHLERMIQLQELDVSGTKLSAAGVQQLLRKPSITRLGLVDLEFDWDLICEYARTRANVNLKLGGPNLTNENLKRLLEKGTLLVSLDVSDSLIDESAFTGNVPATLTELRLSGTQISDSAFSAFLARQWVMSLSVANTSLTDAFLPAISA
ncbi:MAG: hypothetical protein AAGG44_13410, partial [Planctomycetota bacterium]